VRGMAKGHVGSNLCQSHNKEQEMGSILGKSQELGFVVRECSKAFVRGNLS